MLEAYSTNLSISANTNVTFGNKNLQTGTTAVLGSDNATVSLNKPGIYRVDFNATGGTTAAGGFEFQLLSNTSTITRAMAAANTAGSGAVATVSFSTLIPVSSAPSGNTAKLTVQYVGDAGIIDLANIIVTKIA